MKYEVIFTLEADAHLGNIYEYIRGESSPETAQRFTDSIVNYCNGFSTFPNRGTLRDDLRPGLRVVGFRRRGAIVIREGNAITREQIYGLHSIRR